MDQLRNLFFLYMDSPRRRKILNETTDPKGDKYLLYGLDEYLMAGYKVRHNLETAERSSRFVHVLSRLINSGIRYYGGIGGDFRSIIACLLEMNRSDIILSTVDPVGVPLALFKANNLIRRPVVYTSVGLPERMHRFRNEKVANRYCKVFSKLDALVGYGYEECLLLKSWLQPEGASDSVHFVPFGVDVNYFSATEERAESVVDILSIGADPRRDFSLLLALGKSRPSFKIEIITNKEHAGQLSDLPKNIKIVCDIPIELMKSRMEAAAVVVLPIKENSYSGATTTLLQAMAMKKPVVVSRVGAIRDGYYLKDGYNCLFIEPGDEEELIRKTDLLVSDVQLQKTIARNACKTVRQNLTWEHYVNNMRVVLNHCYQEYLKKEQ